VDFRRLNKIKFVNKYFQEIYLELVKEIMRLLKVLKIILMKKFKKKKKKKKKLFPYKVKF
jgi:hypothetical protein